MATSIPLALQTAYAELVERCAAADFEQTFEGDGGFVAKTIKDRRYWYFQSAHEGQRSQRYVGPETPELLDRIARHRQHTDDRRERLAIVSTLVRSAHLTKPPYAVGRVVAALAEARIFRLRVVLVGTVAFQTYSAMLGERLPNAAMQTDDIDIAQDRNISIAVEDTTPPLLEVLRAADREFRAVPSLHGAAAFSYRNKQVRVDVLTPNTGGESDAPVRLRALGSDAQQLRFLDFLIRDPEPAVLLHEAGIFVTVPAPERYALHKLIVAGRRTAGTAKAEKDLRQAGALIAVLVRKRAFPLRDAWNEAVARGAKWRSLMLESLLSINMSVRDELLHVAGEARAALPNLGVRFEDAPPRYDLSRAAVLFRGVSTNTPIMFAISREALADHFGEAETNDERTELFRKHRAEIEAMAKTKYLEWPIDDPAITILTSADISRFKSAIEARKRSPVQGST